MEYHVLNDVVPLTSVEHLYNTLRQSIEWKNIGWTGNIKEPLRHWAAYPELDKHSLLNNLWEAVQNAVLEETGTSLQVQRTVLNLYQHGDSSWIHHDDLSPNAYTLVGFLNPYWDLNWGGDFALVKDGEILQAFAPKPGKFVMFKGAVPHGARPVSREAPVPRFGVAFQCKVDNENTNFIGSSSTRVSGVRTPL